MVENRLISIFFEMNCDIRVIVFWTKALREFFYFFDGLKIFF